MDIESVIEQLERTLDLILQNGKDWWDERDIPVLEKAIEACKKEVPKRADSIMPLEDMKKIMKESIDNAKTYGDFLDGMIIGTYKLGIEHGKASCQETIDPLEKELPKKVVILREGNIMNFCCPTCGNHSFSLKDKSRCSKCGQVIDWNAMEEEDNS